MNQNVMLLRRLSNVATPYLYRGTALTTALGVAWLAARYGPVLAAVVVPNCLPDILICRTPMVVSLMQTQILLPSMLHHVGAHLPKT